MKCVFCICSGLHQAEQQTQLERVVQSWRSHVQPKAVSYNGREAPWRGSCGLQELLKMETDFMWIC